MGALNLGGRSILCLMVAGSILPAYFNMYLDRFSFQHDPLLTADAIDNESPVSRMPLQSSAPSARRHRCALLFFGLPRDFKNLTLPTVKKHILQQNRGCDVYVHYFRKGYDTPGRVNNGGKLNADDVLLLLRDVWDLHRINPSEREPIVVFEHDTDESFYAARKEMLQRIRTSKNPDGNYTYLPIFEKSYEFPSSLENIVKQWHSIHSVWSLMEQKAAELNVRYERIGMFRSDVVYLTPIDISLKNATAVDTENRFAVIPAFGPWFNDRMIYGPYNAVKVWATQRFRRIDDHVRDPKVIKKGIGMHSERFLVKRIAPLIKKVTGNKTLRRSDICFLRVRADHSLLERDCFPHFMTPLAVEERPKLIKKMAESTLGRKCVFGPLIFLKCG